MILTPEDCSRKHIADGGWTRVTIDQVFRRGLQASPASVAFRDVGAGAVPGLDTSLTFTEADRRIEGLAAFFAGIGLKPDMVIGLHLPACADAAVILLAAWRAGLIVCPLPLHWSRGEMEAAVAAAGIKGIVTAAEIEEDATGELVRDVAAEVFAIRFVFAVGRSRTDGLIDLAEVLADLDSLGPAPVVTRRGAVADHVALIGFAHAADDRLVVVPYSQNHLIATALAHLVAARMDTSTHLLSLMHPASVAGAVALLTSLLAGGGLAFHHPTTLAGTVAAAVQAEAGRIVLPAAFAGAVATAGGLRAGLSLVSSGLGGAGDGLEIAPQGATPAVDLLTLGGFCLLPLARGADGRRAPLPFGPTRLGSAPDGAVLFETRVKPRAKAADRKAAATAGELLLAGAVVPDAPWPESAHGDSVALAIGADGVLRTGLEAVVADEAVELRAAPSESFVIAGRTVWPVRLDALVRAHPAVADAAVFPIETAAVGCRLGVAVVPRPGERCDLADLVAWFDSRGGGALDRPVVVVDVAEIPRAQDGAVRRDALFLAAVA